MNPRFNYSMYYPGLATAVLLLLPIGVWFIVASTTGLLSGWDWLWGILYFFAALLIDLILPEKYMASKTSKHAATTTLEGLQNLP